MSASDQKRTKSVTYQDLFDLPEYKVGEIVEGELYASPRPSGRHGLSTIVLAHELVGPFQLGRNGPGGWWILIEPEVHFGENVLVPDLAAWRKDRLGDVGATFFTTPPDWICEILSPSTARLDRIRKMPLYAREGVQHAWLIDPIDRTLETFVRTGDAWRTVRGYEETEMVRAPPFEDVEIDLSILWAPGSPG